MFFLILCLICILLHYCMATQPTFPATFWAKCSDSYCSKCSNTQLCLPVLKPHPPAGQTFDLPVAANKGKVGLNERQRELSVWTQGLQSYLWNILYSKWTTALGHTSESLNSGVFGSTVTGAGKIKHPAMQSHMCKNWLFSLYFSAKCWAVAHRG